MHVIFLSDFLKINKLIEEISIEYWSHYRRIDDEKNNVRNRLKIKSITHSRDDIDIFLFNKGTWIDCMKELQVSGTLSK